MFASWPSYDPRELDSVVLAEQWRGHALVPLNWLAPDNVDQPDDAEETLRLIIPPAFRARRRAAIGRFVKRAGPQLEQIPPCRAPGDIRALD